MWPFPKTSTQNCFATNRNVRLFWVCARASVTRREIALLTTTCTNRRAPLGGDRTLSPEHTHIVTEWSARLCVSMPVRTYVHKSSASAPCRRARHRAPRISCISHVRRDPADFGAYNLARGERTAAGRPNRATVCDVRPALCAGCAIDLQFQWALESRGAQHSEGAHARAHSHTHTGQKSLYPI